MEIWLYLDSKEIKQQQWEAFWNECHEVLQCFPVPLTALEKHIFETSELWPAMRGEFIAAR